MVCRRHLATVWVLCLLGNAFCVPTGHRRTRGYAVNDIDFSKDSVSAGSGDSVATASENVSSSTPTSTLDPFDDDDDDDDFSEPMQSSPTGGSNILSLLRLASALFPSSTGGGASPLLRRVMREILAYNYYPGYLNLRRSDTDNVIEVDEIQGLKPPPFQRQEIEEDSEQDSSESEESNGDDDNGDDDDENGTKEESTENGNGGNSKASDQELDDDDDDDYDEPPEGDGQGGGVLGILASLSGGEDGQSDLGSLLATVSGIVANLSGDGIDLNALIASGLGLFVGLLSEGEENPGAVIASYLLTSLDTITGGGAKNNGAFFGTLVSKLVKGTSAAGDPDASSEEGGGMPMADSAGFVLSLIMSLLGDMSKSSSGGSSHPWRRYEERMFRLDHLQR